MFESCMFTLSSMILSYLYIKKYFTNFQYPVSWLFFCFRQDRPTGPVDRSLYPGRARLCMSVGRPSGRPTESSLLSSFLGRPDRSTAFRKLCFLLEDGRPEPNGYMPAGRTADRTGRPPGLQRSNGSFLFCVNLKICFWSVLWHIFFEF